MLRFLHKHVQSLILAPKPTKFRSHIGQLISKTHRSKEWTSQKQNVAIDSIFGDPRYQTYLVHMGVSENKGTPKWMVCNGKPY